MTETLQQRWTPDEILTVARAFQETRILLTAAQLDIFTRLDAQPHSAEDIAEALKVDTRPVRTLLDALAAMGLLTKSHHVYSCPGAIASSLSSRSPTSLLPMVLHSAGMWNNWARLTELAGGPHGALAAASDEARTRAFIGAMAVLGREKAGQIVEVIEPRDALNLIDVGGASGTFTIAFLNAAPRMRATLFDRPMVIEMARERLAEEGLLDRVSLHGGDFSVDPLPNGHDLALVSAIIHQNGPDENIALFRNVSNALLPGGRIVIRDQIMSDDHTSPKSGAIFAINMLVATEHGGTYTFAEISDALAKAGFEHIAVLKGDAEMDSLIDAYKPRAEPKTKK